MNLLTLYNIVLVILALLYLSYFFYGIIKKRNTLTRIFVYLCLFSAVFIIGVLGQLQSNSNEELMFFQKLKFFGLANIPVLSFLFVYRIYKRGLPNQFNLFLLFCIPVIIIFTVSTNEYHHLFYKVVNSHIVDGYRIATREVGPLYWLNGIYSYILGVLTFIISFLLWRDTKYSKNSPFLMLFLSMLVGIILNMLYLLGLTPSGVDLLPISFLITAIFYAIAILKLNILDLDVVHHELIFSTVKEGIIVTDLAGTLTHCNKSASKIFPWLNPQNRGKNLSDFPDGELLFSKADSDFTLDIEVSDQIKTFDINVSKLIFDDKHIGFTYILYDETEKYNLLKKTRYLARHDGLSGIYNKATILAEAKKYFSIAKEQQSTMSVVMLDFDDFKYINDKYGHMAGDKVIMGLSQVIKETYRDLGLYGRFGGDEFILVFKDLSLAETKDYVEKLREECLKRKFIVDGVEVKKTISIGITFIDFSKPTPTTSLDQLIDQADRALYRAKKDGVGKTIVF